MCRFSTALAVAVSVVPCPQSMPSTNQQDTDTAQYLGSQKDDGDTYNPFAALLKKK